MPNAPETVLVDTLSETALKISWSVPSQNSFSLTHYYVNITALAGFDSLASPPSKDSSDQRNRQPFLMQLKVSVPYNVSYYDYCTLFP